MPLPTEDGHPGNGRVPKVLVTGDVVMDHYVYVGQHRRPGSTILDGTRHLLKLGGAGLVFELLDSLAKRSDTLAKEAKQKFDNDEGGRLEQESRDRVKKAEREKSRLKADEKRKKLDQFHAGRQLKVYFGLNQIEAEKRARAGHCLMEPCAKTENSKERVWRLKRPLGFSHENVRFDANLIDDQTTNGKYDVLVIDDAGVEFGRRPNQDAWPRQIRNGTVTPPKWVVLKLSAPVAAGDLWHTLASGALQDHPPTNVERIRPALLLKRSIAIMSISDLRVEQMHVTKALSWERAALDLVEELETNPHLSPLKRCRFSIITFGTDGALLADFGVNEKSPRQYFLVFDPANLEGDFSKRFEGGAFGFQSCFTAAIVLALNSVEPNDSSQNPVSELTKGIRTGLCGMRRMLVEGHGRENTAKPAFPVAAVIDEILALEHDWIYSTANVPTLKHGKPSSHVWNSWTIVEGEPKAAKRPLFGTARRVALRGPSELRNVPYQHFGDLFTVDRSEIESLLSLRQLIRDYLIDKEVTKPLSIAVFGAPGSGKSFGVKQLAKAVMGDKVPILEFNLSQFREDPNELIGLYHEVRDKVLEGKTPVVFWDEFDSRELYWLQYLLAPMQDGKFQVGQESHPIGKCIFVFAGGTSHTFGNFGPPEPDADSSDEERIAWSVFRSKKGPDFKSRLSGHLDVLGPNQRQILIDPKKELREPDPNDVSFPIRRALLLRVKLGLIKERAGERLNIDPGLLSAFLEIDRYKHGARSMEKIAEQVRAHSHIFEFHRSDIPPDQQLNLHVDARYFHAKMERDLAYQIDVDELAAAIHSYYEDRYPSPPPGSLRPEDDPVKVKLEFAELPEFLKEDNRAAARRICEVLGSVGLYLTKIPPMSPTNEQDVTRIIMDNLATMAEAEHEGWILSRKRHGWRPCPPNQKTSFQNREHASIRPYSELVAAEQQKDENVKEYVKIIENRGYFIVPDPPNSTLQCREP